MAATKTPPKPARPTTEVVKLDGSPINWVRPPKATTKVRWSKRDMYGRYVTGSFRTICHLNRLNILAKKRFGVELVVIQPPYNTTVAASAGTHDKDACIDLYIPGVDWWVQQRFFRANGFMCWYRHPPLFGNHIHGFTLAPAEGRNRSDDWKVAGFEVGKYVDGGYTSAGRKYTSSQVEDGYNHAFGLSGQHEPNSDKSWWPDDIDATIFDLKKYVKTRANRQKRAAA